MLTISIHQDPSNFYPGTDFLWQTGGSEGRGFKLNYPLPAGTSEREYLPILDEAIQKINKFCLDILFVVLGVDTFKEDTLGGFRLERRSYSKIASKIVKLCGGGFRKIPTVILFAGGYSDKVPELWLEFVKNLV